MKATVRWVDGAMFEATADTGHTVVMDGAPEIGGRNRGSRPMEVVLMGAGYRPRTKRLGAGRLLERAAPAPAPRTRRRSFAVESRLAAPVLVGIRQRDRTDQQTGVGVLRCFDNLLDTAHFGHCPPIEDVNVLTDLISGR